MKWLLWWYCRDCKQILKRHDPEYLAKHDAECPPAAAVFPKDMAEWRQHIWSQGRLLRHECGCPHESPAD